MRKTNILTVRNLMENGIYKRDLKGVTIEVYPQDEFIYEDKQTIDTVDILVREKNPVQNIINSVYDVNIKDIKKVLEYLVEIYAADNFHERHYQEFKSFENNCIN